MEYKKKIVKTILAGLIFGVSFTATSAWKTATDSQSIESNVKAGLVCDENTKELYLNIFFVENLEKQGLIYGEWESSYDKGSLDMFATGNVAKIVDIKNEDALVASLKDGGKITFKAHSDSKIYGTEVSLKKFNKAFKNLEKECK